MADQNQLIVEQAKLILIQGALIEQLNKTVADLNTEVTQLKSQGIPNSMDPEINNRLKTLEELSKLRLAPTCEHLSMYGITKSGTYNLNLNKDELGAKLLNLWKFTAILPQ